jgi:hypothetical protein
MTDEPDIEAIARGLTKGDVQRLLSLPAHGDGLWRGYENLHLAELMHLDVVKNGNSPGSAIRGWRGKATPLGLHVRAYLMENPDGQ